MIGIVLISHGKMAEGMKDSLSMFFGDTLPQFEICSLGSSDSADEFREALSQKVTTVDQGDGVLIFADMLGGTPCNQALRLVNDKVHVLVGMNLPMIMELLGLREAQETGIESLLESGRNAIQDAGALLLSNSGDDEDDD